MCDTVLAMPDSSANGSMLFGKNSDRQCNEAQLLEYVPRRRHSSESEVACTYISVPQVRETHAVLLSRPFWIWGAEMGANEHGVVIGNEGIHARIGAPQESALIGMDLLRLALERGSSAGEALEIITTLLERHGQGGNCGHLIPAYYNNGFMIADAREAYVLETIGRDWMVERVAGVRAISNAYSIRRPHRCSARFWALLEQITPKDDPNVDCAAVIADPNREHIGNAGARRACSTALLNARRGRLDVGDMMSILRSHGDGDQLQLAWREECLAQRTLCMHAAADGRAGQTTGSMVSQLRPGCVVHWVTGTAAPCISIFKPVLVGVPLPEQGPPPTDQFDARTLWWRHERIHRAALMSDFGKFLNAIQDERDELEAQFRTRIDRVIADGDEADRTRVVAECWREALELESSWMARVGRPQPVEDSPFVSNWRRLNQLAGL
jgi:secernin